MWLPAIDWMVKVWAVTVTVWEYGDHRKGLQAACSLGTEPAGLGFAGVGGPTRQVAVGWSRMALVDVFRPIGSLTGLVYIPVDVTNALKFIIPIIEQGGEVKVGSS